MSKGQVREREGTGCIRGGEECSGQRGWVAHEKSGRTMPGMLEEQ